MTRRSLLWVLGVGLAANALLWLPLPGAIEAPVQALAVLVLAGLLPGLLLVDALLGRSAAPPTRWERLLLSVGVGYALMVSVTLLASYLPGALEPWQTLAAVNGLLLLLWALALWRSRILAPTRPADEWAGMDTRWLLAGALVLLLLGAGLRFVNLGYPDYQGDEARAALRAAAVIQGYDDVLMLHKKGPTEILLPTLLYSATGHLTEQTARLPFAVAGLVALFAAWLLGWRLFGPVAGWLAALLIALDGYFIGFARIVQYQRVVLLMSLLAVYVVVRVYQQPRPPWPTATQAGWLSLAAVFLATGILSHYEGVLPALPAAFLLAALIWDLRRTPGAWKQVALATLIAAAVGGALLALFYIPYVTNPRFAATYYYLTDRRIGNSFPYNNVHDVWTRTTLYSTTYLVLLLVGLTLAGVLRVFWRGWNKPVAALLSTAALLLFIASLWNASWATLGTTDWLIVPVALVFGFVCITPKMTSEERAIWLWFSAVMILALFLTEKPR
ncbi:MAG: glycosyltransferase family 39 protein, partial [Caldilineaceae bacterium]